MSRPNQLTVFRMILTPLFATILILTKHIYLRYFSLFLFVFACLTDWYDGYVARKSGNITLTGKYLDPLADKILISTAFGVFTYLGYVDLWMFLVIALRDAIITALRSYGISKNQPLVTSTSAKWKTACQMLAIYLIFIWMILKEQYAVRGTEPEFVSAVEEWHLIHYLMLFVTLFTVYTGASYLYENRRHLKSLAIACYRVFVPTNVR
ncbi:CDP-diacylglycerol--glycerol-3-phosphate 3-phosphatidyltransferase [candidate division KSB1 bacterium]|nr:CDP-diacylglycerol--glycerol-3-phosphate 3-phosphatidyltransferase [candidate division KSB1 bacterium]NIR69596.1 CDP-diacylglycerol--glycerol-3-phosphate 3-phosphatidyltransferase [candidate division KSB1 bacterium]NIS24313.1 CDP-diacylglycerol--glycerol-3-phosphate 3-phosphatidyltransferase [candidate division KSB1 bacterium]NIT71241.1 CDP-diacylglycerol--glycerol-3-phosphate 3-phosphatidyltransferase [candidate division KSB1 bacterium]NIU24945.1 CDP-diacylglycerol--glycerol-3-phosphate 3-p